MLYFLAAATTVAATDQGRALMHAKLRWLSAINSQVARIRREPKKDSEELRAEGESQPWPAHRLGGGGDGRWGAAFRQGSAAYGLKRGSPGGMGSVPYEQQPTLLSHSAAPARLARAAGKYASAGDVIAFFADVEEQALVEYGLAGTEEERGSAARLVLDAVHLNVSFGYYPPPRPAVLASCAEPGYEGPCT